MASDIKVVEKRNKNQELHTKSWFVRMHEKYQLFLFKHKFWAFTIKFLFTVLEFLILATIILTISFFLIDSAPGKPSISSSLNGPSAAAVEAKYHLNDPAINRLLTYLGGLFRLDFGVSLSIFPGVEINDFVWERFGTSTLVGSLSLIITIVLGIPLGVWAGRKITGFSSLVSSLFIAIMISIPSMVFGLILLLLGRSMGLPYIFEQTNMLTWLIPAIALALPSTITYIKYLRTTMNQEISSQHAKFASLKGISRRSFIWRHALKPSLFPIATFFPFAILAVFSGALFIEKIFLIPGAGFLTLQAAQTKDVYVLLFMVLAFTLMTILAFKLRDWLYTVLDPRLRRRG